MNPFELDARNTGDSYGPHRYPLPLSRRSSFDLPPPPPPAATCSQSEDDATSLTIQDDDRPSPLPYRRLIPPPPRRRLNYYEQADRHSFDCNDWRAYNAPEGEPTEAVYEAYEIKRLEPLWEEDRFWGITWPVTIKVWRRYQRIDTDDLNWRSLPWYTQKYLKETYEEAKTGFSKKWFSRKNYAANLRDRIDKLPEDQFEFLMKLLDNRINATNRSKYRQRSWEIVWMEYCPDGSAAEMHELKSTRKSPSLFRKKRSKEPHVWRLILRGQEYLHNPEGFTQIDRYSNPWRKVDGQDNEERNGHKVLRDYDY